MGGNCAGSVLASPEALLDNLRSHKVAGIAEAIAARGAQLVYLPPYSPDLNPIEQAFAKYKALLRKAAERTVESLWQTIGRIADLFPPAECRNFFNTLATQPDRKPL